jgi:hypothetical protein
MVVGSSSCVRNVFAGELRKPGEDDDDGDASVNVKRRANPDYSGPFRGAMCSRSRSVRARRSEG